MRQGRVVQGSIVPRRPRRRVLPGRRPAVRDGRSAGPAVTPKAQSARRGRSTSVPVKVIAGCIAIGRAPTAAAGLEDRQAVPAAGVHDVLTGTDGSGCDEHLARHCRARRREPSAAADRRLWRPQSAWRRATPGKHRLDPGARGIGLTADGDDLVAGAAQSGGQNGADAASADDADPKQRPHGSRRAKTPAWLRPFRSSPARGTRRMSCDLRSMRTPRVTTTRGQPILSASVGCLTPAGRG